MAGVTFRNVTKRFGDTYAVRDFNLEIADEEFLVLVGPSGCGKSTTLRMLAGLEDISSGEIWIGDRLVNHVAARDRNIAMVFQSYALYPHMTVYDNMAFGLQLRKVAKAEIRQRVEEAAGILGIEDLLQRKPRQLSGGQRQRVALGRAIVRDPAVFLLDEPLSNLDAKLRVRTRAEISKLHERLKTTFVYVTHDQVEAMTMATRIAVMDRGELQQVGTPQELYDLPRNRFVAEFIGSPAMNIFAARVVEKGENLVLEADGLNLIVPMPEIPLFQPYRGQTIDVGIRPEDIHDAAYQPPGIDGAEETAAVDVTELLGSETLLHVQSGATELMARVDPRTAARPGQEVRLAFDMAKLHRFSPETGERLASHDEATRRAGAS